MKILIIDHDPRFSGSTKSMFYLIEELRENFEVILLSQKPKGILKQISSQLNIQCLAIPQIFTLNIHFDNDYNIFTPLGVYSVLLSIKRYFIGYKYAKRIFTELKPDLIYLNEYVLLQFASAAKKLEIKTATHIRSQIIKGNFGFRKKLVSKLIAKNCDFIFSISEVEKNQLSKIARSKTTVIREFLNEENYMAIDKSQIQQKLGIPKNKTVVLFLGGIYKIKGSLVFLKAARKIIENSDSILFILAGSQMNNTKPNQKYFSECKEFISYNSWNNQFIEIDYNIDAKEYINACDILVSANTFSHFARPIIEAWALKKPVICSDTKHNFEIVNDKNNCLVYKKYDESDLAYKILLLNNNGNLREKIGWNGYNNSLDLFNPQKNIKKISEIFHSIEKNK